ncbi:hypothetical protein [Halobacillus litoralis]|uniref:hypothetical protein n=1 Tax=Halobacillus litoralis TaxID=45668 RepID=UPI001CFC553C|nr:hypothetical protein [Halobacillus litoralis]
MSEKLLGKVRRGLLSIAFVMAAFVLSYCITYPLGYSPLGYEVLEKKEGSAVLQSYNTWGQKEVILTYHPPEGEEWKLDWLIDRIHGQEQEYLFFFTSMIVAVGWIAFDVRKGKPLKKVLPLSCLYVFISGLSLITHLHDIQSML